MKRLLLVGLFLVCLGSVYAYLNPPKSEPSAPIVTQKPVVPKAMPDITAGSYLLVVYDGNKLHTLAAHHEYTKRRIASITKLVTALVADNQLSDYATIIFKKDDLLSFGTSGFYKVGQTLDKNMALNSLLIESNNDVARALASSLPKGTFVQHMNDYAKKLGMTSTEFFNSSGLEESSTSTTNYSTAQDLTLLAKEYIDTYRDLLSITTKKEVTITLVGGALSHKAVATDKLLTDTDFSYEILGGKTGETAVAKKNLLLIARNKEEPLVYIGIVLYSDDHFADMKKLFSTIE